MPHTLKSSTRPHHCFPIEESLCYPFLLSPLQNTKPQLFLTSAFTSKSSPGRASASALALFPPHPSPKPDQLLLGTGKKREQRQTDMAITPPHTYTHQPWFPQPPCWPPTGLTLHAHSPPSPTHPQKSSPGASTPTHPILKSAVIWPSLPLLLHILNHIHTHWASLLMGRRIPHPM